MELPLYRSMKLIEIAEEEEVKAKAYQFYLHHTPIREGTNKYIPFDEYYESNKSERVILDNRPKDELIKEIKNIEKKVR